MASSVSFPSSSRPPASVSPGVPARVSASGSTSDSPLAAAAGVSKAASATSSPRLDLASLALGARGRVVHLDLDDELRAWLSAVGIAVGEHVTLLRRAAFGGPVHVRTSVGGEFALNRSLARAILICLEADDDAESAA